MTGGINLTGIPVDYAVPITAVEVRFGQGPSGGGAQDAILLIGNKTSAGSGTTDTVVYGPSSSPPLQTENDIIALAGSGSEAHRMYMRCVSHNGRSTPVYAVFPAEGGSATAAALTLTLATTATGPGVLRIYVGDEFCDTPISTGSLPADIATAAAQKINNQTKWAVTAAPSSATVVITSKNKGLRANEIRVRALMMTSCAMTVTGAAVPTALSGGTVTDDWTTALTTILPIGYSYIVSPSNDITQHTFDDLVAQVLTQALPITGIRQCVIAGHVGTQSAASTIAANAAVNSPRVRIVWQEESELTAGELASALAGIVALFEARDPAYNKDGLGSTTESQSFWHITPQSQQSKWPTSGVSGSIAAAVNNGLCCVAVTENGTGTYLVMDVTTKHKSGSNYDYRNRDAHITKVCDVFATEAGTVVNDMRAGKKLVSDPPRGTIVQDPATVFPALIKARVGAVVSRFGDNGRFKNVPDILAGIRWQVSPTNASRSEGYVPAQVINLHHQAMLLVDDVSSTI